MGVPALVGPELNSDENANYASLLLNLIARGFTGPVSFFSSSLTQYWVPVDMGNPSDTDPLASWRRWSYFHALTGFSAGIQPLLRLSTTPLAQWTAEPLDTLLLPVSCFTWLDAVRLFPRFHLGSRDASRRTGIVSASSPRKTAVPHRHRGSFGGRVSETADFFQCGRFVVGLSSICR